MLLRSRGRPAVWWTVFVRHAGDDFRPRSTRHFASSAMSRLFAAAGAGAGAASSWLQVLFAIIVFIDEIKFVNGGVIIPDTSAAA